MYILSIEYGAFLEIFDKKDHFLHDAQKMRAEYYRKKRLI